MIVDSSVLIDFLSGKESKAVSLLSEIEKLNLPFYIPAICLQEVLQGARDEKSWNMLYEYLSSQRIVYPKNDLTTYVEAAKIYYDCRKSGITIRSSTDCLIAQLALENDMSLLHNDQDFAQISRVRKLKFPKSLLS